MKGAVYVACYGSHSVARISWDVDSDRNVTNTTKYFVGAGFAADEPGDGDMPHGKAADVVRLTNPTDVALFQAGQRLYIADATNPSVLDCDLATMTVHVVIPRPGLYNYAGRNDVGPVGLALESARIPGFTVLYNTRSFDEKTWIGRWFFFDSTIVPELKAGVHTVYHYRDGNLLKILHLKIYLHIAFMAGGQDACPSCNAQGLNNETFILNEFQIGDIIYMDYYFPKTRQRLYMGEGHNQIVRYSDLTHLRPYMCEPGWDVNHTAMPAPLPAGDDGQSGYGLDSGRRA